MPDIIEEVDEAMTNNRRTNAELIAETYYEYHGMYDDMGYSIIDTYYIKGVVIA